MSPITAVRNTVDGLPRAFWALWTGMLITRLGDFVVPFLAIYLTEARQLPVATAGFVVSLFGLGSIASGPVGGQLADRLGRRKTLIGVMLLSACTMALLGQARQPTTIAVLVGFLGFVSQAYRPASSATIADLVPSEARAHAYGLLYWAVNLGFAFSSMLGGLIASRNFSALFWADAATTLACTAVIWRFVPETRPQAGSAATLVNDEAPSLAPHRDGLFLIYVLITFVYACIATQFNTAVPLEMRAHGISTGTFGMLAAINGVMIICLQPFAAPLVRRLSPTRVLAAAALLIGMGMALNGMADAAWGYGLSIVIWTCGEIIGSVVSPTLVAEFAPETHRGRYQGIYQMAWGTSVCLGPIIGTQLLQRYGAHVLWSGCLLAGLVSGAGYLALGRPLQRRLAAKNA